MKNYFLLFVLCIILGSCSSDKKLENDFKNPPADIQTSVYWYWISGNISKEGVIKDLESMKEAGINRAFIGNIGLGPGETPPGPVKLFTDEWWEIVHTALKKATELGIDIGMFNCPGWSQAGGPWIEPGQAMRYLASSKTEISGGKNISLTLDKPQGDFQDMKVLAIPKIKGEEIIIKKESAVLSKEMKAVFTVKTPEPIHLRSVEVITEEAPIRCMVDLKVKNGNDFETLKTFEVNRTNPNPEVGFIPYSPIVISVPETEGKEFQLVFHQPGAGNIKEIKLSSLPKIERYPEKTFAKMFQEPLPYWHEYTWAQQPEANNPMLAIAPDQVIDVTRYLSGDTFTWQAPEGEWVILRMGMLPTQVMNDPAAAEGRGLEVDKITTAYLQHHFDSFIGEIPKRIPEQDRKALKVIVADSYERGGQNMSDNFLEEFQDRYGYDPLPFLPVYEGIVVGTPDISDRFLWDMRRLVADKLSYEHIGGLRKVANQHGLTLWLENYGHWGYPGEFLQYGGQSDEISGEFWSEGTLGDIENRAASSCGHIYGKTKISAESYTCGGAAFSRYPASIKPRGDRFFSEGINNTLLHVYISQYDDEVYPGTNAGFGNEFNRKNTWFSHLDLFTAYLKRTNFMLQQGLNVADVAYFIGEDAPKMTGITYPVLPKGYQFDYINAEVILNNLTIKNGLFTLPHGTQYKLLVLPPQETMRPEVLAKIKQLVEEGGAILGPIPSQSPSLENYPHADEELTAMASELWKGIDGNNTKLAKVGKGVVMNNMDMTEALAVANCIPDCKIADEVPVLYGHRDLGNTQVYYLTNQSDRRIQFTPEFRVTGMIPEYWDPVQGTTRSLPSYEVAKNTTRVPIQLEPSESAFIVFKTGSRKSLQASYEANFPTFTTISRINFPWTVSFEDTEAKRGPSQPIVLDRLIDISTSDNEQLKYYSGTMQYENTITLEDKNAVYLNLNNVGVIAKVYINDQYAGGVWTAPYRLNITPWAKTGENKIRIEVINNWMNRLIGDKKLPLEERKTYSPNIPWGPESTLQKSGLIGPVVIETVNY